MNHANSRLVIFHEPGPLWDKGVLPFQQSGIEAHVTHYRSMLSEGRLFLGGPFMDDRGGGMMVAEPGADREQLETFAASDPTVKSGLLRCSVREWLPRMGNGANAAAQAPKLPPVRKTVHVDSSIDQAFDIFTKGMNKWWPRSGYTTLKDPLAQVIVEPFAGGRWYHVGEGGAQCDIGRVLLWEPPQRVVLGWQLNGNWQYEPNATSEVDVSFRSVGKSGVEVTLEHRALDVFGATAQSLRAAVDSEGGWPLLLGLYASAAR